MRGSVPLVHFPAVPAGPEITISASTYLAYLRCPGSAVARLEGRYGPESRAAFRGNLAHRIFARHLTEGPIDDGEFLQACKEEVGRSMNGKLLDLGLRPSELRDLVREVGELYARFRSVALGTVVAAEVEVLSEVRPGVRLRGFVDAVFADTVSADTVSADAVSADVGTPAVPEAEGGPASPNPGVAATSAGVRLVDWKTGRIDEEEVGRQLAFYALLWALEHGVMPELVEAVSPATGERLRWTPGLDELTQVATEVAEAVTVLRRLMCGGEAELRGGPWCRSCGALDGCPEGAAAVSVLGR